MSIQSLETKRLLLKELTFDHVDDYTEGFVNYEVIRHMNSRVPWPYPAGGVKTFFETVIFPEQGKTLWAWGIFEKHTPLKLIGSISLRRSNVDNRGFWLAQPYWGKGYMTEAADAVTDYAFEVLGFDVLRFTNAKGNLRSRRIKEKRGARLVRVTSLKSVDPLYTASEHWELTKKEWANNRNNL